MHNTDLSHDRETSNPLVTNLTFTMAPNRAALVLEEYEYMSSHDHKQPGVMSSFTCDLGSDGAGLVRINMDLSQDVGTISQLNQWLLSTSSPNSGNELVVVTADGMLGCGALGERNAFLFVSHLLFRLLTHTNTH